MGAEDIVIEGNFVDPFWSGWRQVVVNRKSGLIKEVYLERITLQPDWAFGTKLLFPGFVDLHVHAREDTSGKHNYKEDFFTAGEAALNGGVIAIAEMPNNPIPPVDAESYAAKEELAEKCAVPVLLYAGIGPGTRPFKREGRDVPYKVFMDASFGGLGFSSRSELEQAVSSYHRQAISFHCEDPEILAKYKDEPTHEQRRPAKAEVEAIKFALELTERYDLQTKICHLSTAEGLELCTQAKRRGLPVTIEVTPHHLYFDQGNLTAENRHLLQMNPPLRSLRDRVALMEALKRGEIEYLVTDHAPHTLAEKETGVSGVPHLDTYGLFAAELITSLRVSKEMVARICAYNPGMFMNKFLGTNFGRIASGYLGMFVEIDKYGETIVNTDYLRTKCGWSPFENIPFPSEEFPFEARVNVFDPLDPQKLNPKNLEVFFQFS